MSSIGDEAPEQNVSDLDDPVQEPSPQFVKQLQSDQSTATSSQRSEGKKLKKFQLKKPDRATIEEKQEDSESDNDLITTFQMP